MGETWSLKCPRKGQVNGGAKASVQRYQSSRNSVKKMLSQKIAETTVGVMGRLNKLPFVVKKFLSIKQSDISLFFQNELSLNLLESPHKTTKSD